MSSVRRNSIGKVHWLVLVVLTGVAFVILFFVVKGKPLPTPVLIGQANSEPLSIQCIEGTWYWREQPLKGKGRLVRATTAGIKEFASAESLTAFDTDGSTLVWTARDGITWSVMSANSDGSGGHPVWSGKEEPMGVKLTQGRIYWLRRTPAVLDTSLPFPPLQSSLQVVSLPTGGGTLDVGATLAESDTGRVLGIYEGVLYVAALRMSRPGSTVVYRVEAQDKTPKRIASTERHLPALLTREGDLYWLAPSMETNSPQPAMHLFHRDKAGVIEPLSDWLPMGGTLYETSHGIMYADKEYPPNFWSAGSQADFPTALPLPKDFTAIAASDKTAIVAPASSSRAKPMLYQIPLP
ncbi:MAG: hypothetical protein NT023_16870 [Armatimonadetes bacterium]|nr:hypothetical protein [Armatimonadota bacterium]